MISIIDYGAGNLMSVKNALDFLKVDSRIVSSVEGIESADSIILPGVGSFGYLMESLKEKGLMDPLLSKIRSGTPFLGICLGLQALFESSEESPGVAGLGIFKGKVVKFSKGKVPQIGWNKVLPNPQPCRRALTENFSAIDEGYAYFVHSYYVVPEDKSIAAAVSDYFGEYCCAIQWKNITAVQFHPEKSGGYGLRLLERWCKC